MLKSPQDKVTGNLPNYPHRWISAGLTVLFILLTWGGVWASDKHQPPAGGLAETINRFSGLAGRPTGSQGAALSARWIHDAFVRFGYETVGVQRFTVPVRVYGQSRAYGASAAVPMPLEPLVANAISPGTIAPPGLEGPLVYVGSGELRELNGRTIEGAIVLMELASGRNWLNVAALGAKALIYVNRGVTSRLLFEDKQELSPLDFPRFMVSEALARQFWGDFDAAGRKIVLPHLRLVSDMRWEPVTAQNVYCIIPGRNPELADRLILVEAFYDTLSWLPGRSPGADEAASIASLLEVARYLTDHPPDRTVMLVATAGHAQTLAGMRELIWSLSERSRNLNQYKRHIQTRLHASRKHLSFLDRADAGGDNWLSASDQIKASLGEELKSRMDRISRQLMRLRLERSQSVNHQTIKQLGEQRLILQRLNWADQYSDLPAEMKKLLIGLLPDARSHFQQAVADLQRQAKDLESSMQFRSLVRSYELDAVVSLHLSSHGDGVGAFSKGWLHPLKPQINRVSAYRVVDEVLRKAALEVQAREGLPSLYKDTLRPNRLRPWESHFIDRPALGGEISALAGLIGLSLVTTNDARLYWGSPFDTVDRIDWSNLIRQVRLVCGLISEMAAAQRLHDGTMPRNGFSIITGQANFLRHGELFADQPAPGSILLSYQGPGKYYTMVDATGRFMIKGVADKKHLLHKVIIEGYRFDAATGQVKWAIDKNQTGKSAYRVKMNRRYMQTNLVMFACRQTTVFDLLEPRNLSYLTKIQLIDGRLEALPIRYWYSRIDTRDSTISSIYLEPGTRLKLILSDNIIQNKMILTNGNARNSLGLGYRIDQWPRISPTNYLVAKDMWTLLEPRVENLETHGIHDQNLRDLQDRGIAALDAAETALAEMRYDRFFEAARQSWALAMRVYNRVDKVQKDVLLGVLFYVALFVPFAFCMERFLFSHRNIYKRITSFLSILVALILIIYKVHPAFQLAYSPLVVILAFFTIGLAALVALIIFFRFESEMVHLQRNARQFLSEDASMWKSFTTAFILGVSNLRRRRLRTVLTCLTLILLTFTVMSFTSVKTFHQHSRLKLKAQVSYPGFLLKNINWRDLPKEALGILPNAFGPQATVAPRVWLETANNTSAPQVPVAYNGRRFEARGLMGLSAAEQTVTGLDAVLVAGRWFKPSEDQVVLIPDRMAAKLNLDLDNGQPAWVYLWGVPYQVVGIFDARQLDQRLDLDGEPVTPAVFPSETAQQVTEVEMEAFEEGEDVLSIQSRYQHVAGELTLLLPDQTLLSLGGRLKAVAVKPVSEQTQDMQTQARHLVDRFGLSLFSGEGDGTYLYNASDQLAYSGIPNIVIPLLISIFIVLNTMIGSVYERKNEIGIYTSVGLTPGHVSFLFIAEALAMAVISVVLGYLLAQISTAIMGGTTLWSSITVNYSSLNGVGAMLLVIVVVLISVIYPSRVASQIAIPDIEKSWKMPLPEGNAIRITLPFLIRCDETVSACGYLYDFLLRHEDVSQGIFSSAETRFAMVPLETDAGSDGQPADQGHCQSVKITAKIWLAPFDLGIMQQAELLVTEAVEEEGFMEVQMLLQRRSGESNVWHRINRRFIMHLRKQLLVWRALDDEQKGFCATLLPGADAGCVSTDP